jgi:hypothetical protein
MTAEHNRLEPARMQNVPWKKWSCLGPVVYSANTSAAFTTTKGGLVIRSCALSSR